MNAKLSTITLSFLMVTALAACGTAEDVPPGSDAATDSSADSGDAGSDTGVDTTPDGSGGCSTPDPSISCIDTGCADGMECVVVDGGCSSSACTCEDGEWLCTADCGPAYECVTTTPGCPAEPGFGDACSEEDMYCEYGTECCCGECFASTFCTCSAGGWACGASDACFIESCEGRSCESASDCEGGGFATECVSGVCVAATSGGDWSVGPDVALVEGCDGSTTDGYDQGPAGIDGETLVVEVSYSGGCAEHLFRTCWDGSFMESAPVQARLVLAHDGNDDPCEAYPTEELRISLAPLREAYESAYRTDTGTIIIQLGEASLTFEFDACTGEDLPACPAECPVDAFSRCGEACDASTDEDCGNEIGDAMTCADGAWACTVHPPLGPGCNQICRR